MAHIFNMTQTEKMRDLLYFKGKIENEQLMLNEIINKENNNKFNVILSILG